MRAEDEAAVSLEADRRSHDHHHLLIAGAAAVVAGAAAIVLSGTVDATAWRYLIVAGIIVGLGLIVFAVYADWTGRRVRQDLLAERRRAEEISGSIMSLPDDRQPER